MQYASMIILSLFMSQLIDEKMRNNNKKNFQ